MKNRCSERPGLSLRQLKRGTTVAGAGLLVLLTACGCSPDTAAAAGRAREFHRLLEASDLQGACALLQAKAQKKAAEQAGACEQALEALELPRVGAVLETHVYGRSASVVFESDTVFLATAESGWQVTGAGCTPEGDAPYTCEIGGE
ncbi:hypothetical protein [Arthrobacter sp. ISL-28]|uniref:hypothetical protein n=1 Tax=Arthrobacter sp. ISL-28 TaxID=2819108 RepID=UPI001BE604E9|nr:hypothetical protein [Arthrobacter sp. ISL-28]MBT2521169.1 hypothetical protein [Arthrobacter sp. ISL-28]